MMCTQALMAQRYDSIIRTDSIPSTLEEVVISATKSPQARRNTPQTVNIISQANMQELQARNTADVLASTGQVFVQKSQQGGGSITLRGFEASRNILVIDGIRMNNLIYRSGHLQNIITIDNQSLQRIEILHGPASTMYGSDALGGAVCMYTLVPTFSEKNNSSKINTSVRYGSVNNEFTQHADYAFSGKKWANVTSVTYSVFGDLKSGKNQNPFYDKPYGLRSYYVERINGKDSLMKNQSPHVQKQSGYTQYDLLQKIAYKSSENVQHGLNIQFSNSSDVPRYDRLSDPEGIGLKFAEWYYGPQKRLLAAYTTDIKTGTGLFGNMHSSLYYQDIEESRMSRKFRNDNLQQRIEKVGIMGATIDFNQKNVAHDLNWGIDLQLGQVKSTASQKNIVTGDITSLDTRYPNGKNIQKSGAIYYTHVWHLDKMTTLTDGLRLGFTSLTSSIDDNSIFRMPYQSIKQNNLVYSGNVGLTHQVTDKVKLSALVSSGFRVPNVDDLAKVFESAPGKLIVPNERIKPERTITYEAGIEKNNQRDKKWEVHLYYTDFVDAIITDKYTWNGADSVDYNGTKSAVLANQNKRRAYVYGVQLNWYRAITKELIWQQSGMYTYGRIKTDSADAPLDHIPPIMLRTTLRYELPKLITALSLDYNGKKRLADYMLNGEDNEQYATPDGMPAWISANLHVQWKINQWVTLNTGIDNIFDTQYRTFASGINAPGRNMFASLKISR